MFERGAGCLERRRRQHWSARLLPHAEHVEAGLRSAPHRLGGLERLAGQGRGCVAEQLRIRRGAIRYPRIVGLVLGDLGGEVEQRPEKTTYEIQSLRRT